MDTGRFNGFTADIERKGVLLITFDEPERMNAMTHSLKRDLVETLLQAQMEEAVRVVLFTGTGRAFSAGDDISDKPRGHGGGRLPDIPYGHRSPINSYGSLRTFSQPVQLVVRQLDKISVAAINGFAIQTGLSLALACDFRVAASDAMLGSATLRFGYQPDEGGHYLLVQHLGVGRAMDFMLRNRIVSADEALSLGLVHEVAPREQLMDRAWALAEELANGPQVAMRLMKRAIYNAAEYTFHQAMDDIATKTAISDHHPDAAEGRASFVERRKPTFNQDLP